MEEAELVTDEKPAAGAEVAAPLLQELKTWLGRKYVVGANRQSAD